ncbi:thioredoxin family protein [Chloroflexota bacterium]
MVVELDRDTYEKNTIESREPVLVDFWGEDCAPCLALNPAVEQFEKDFNGRLKVTKVNARQNRMLCARLRVMSLPTFILYKDGSEIKRVTGEMITARYLRETIEQALD